MDQVVIDGGPLTIDEVVAVAEGRTNAVIDHSVWARMADSRNLVDQLVADGAIVYGITTGFGALAGTRIEPEDAEKLQVRLLRSHAAGVGPPLLPEIVRAMLLLRARTMSQGYSGVRPVIIERYLEFLERDLLPVVPSQGSVGASGDLAPFAHLALPLIGEGELEVDGVPRPAQDVLTESGMAPIHLRAKEGLSLLNGTEGMAAWACLGIDRATRLCEAADAAAALSVEALTGSHRPFRPEIHNLRPHPGQAESARVILSYLEGSPIEESHRDDFTHAVQDAYSLRCAPQVHGAVRDTVAHAASVVEREIGSVVDNPIVFAETGEVISAGNFHGQPLAFVLDFLAIALTELGSISERRSDRMLDPTRSNGLPAFLSPEPGVNSGFMLAQYTQASLVAENRVLAHPASVDSIPTSGMQEDHVSMGWGAGKKLHEVVENTARVVGVEIMCAVQALEYRMPMRSTESVHELCTRVRSVVPTLADDRPLGQDIERLGALVLSGELAG